MPAVGKSTIGKRFVEEFGMSYVNKDKMRNYFIGNIEYFKGTIYSRWNHKIGIINGLIRPIADKLILQLLDNKQSVIIDGYGKSKETRNHYKELLKSYDIPIIIIYVKEKEEVIIKRLEERDVKIPKAKWVTSFYGK